MKEKLARKLEEAAGTAGGAATLAQSRDEAAEAAARLEEERLAARAELAATYMAADRKLTAQAAADKAARALQERREEGERRGQAALNWGTQSDRRGEMQKRLEALPPTNKVRLQAEAIRAATDMAAEATDMAARAATDMAAGGAGGEAAEAAAAQEEMRKAKVALRVAGERRWWTNAPGAKNAAEKRLDAARRAVVAAEGRVLLADLPRQRRLASDRGWPPPAASERAEAARRHEERVKEAIRSTYRDLMMVVEGPDRDAKIASLIQQRDQELLPEALALRIRGAGPGPDGWGEGEEYVLVGPHRDDLDARLTEAESPAGIARRAALKLAPRKRTQPSYMGWGAATPHDELDALLTEAASPAARARVAALKLADEAALRKRRNREYGALGQQLEQRW